MKIVPNVPEAIARTNENKELPALDCAAVRDCWVFEIKKRKKKNKNTVGAVRRLSNLCRSEIEKYRQLKNARTHIHMCIKEKLI